MNWRMLSTNVGQRESNEKEGGKMARFKVSLRSSQILLCFDLSIERWAANGKQYTSKCCPYRKCSGAVLSHPSWDKKSLRINLINA
jgi:hypothetical protein